MIIIIILCIFLLATTINIILLAYIYNKEINYWADSCSKEVMEQHHFRMWHIKEVEKYMKEIERLTLLNKENKK